MPFELKWTQESKKSLCRLESELALRIIRKVESIRENPYRHLKRLAGKGVWRLRIGDYRIIIDLDAEKNTFYVLEVGHRRGIYKSR